MADGRATCPCDLCGTPTPMLGTRRCDGCWEREVERRIRRDPDLARRVLAAMPLQYGWLVENGRQAGLGLAYRYIDNDGGGMSGWTEDPNKALRFARREDAEQFAHHDEDAWRIVEHAWGDGPGRAVRK